MTSQTDASWPDHLDAFAFRHHPEVKVLKKEYSAGPFPRLNALKNRRLGAGLVNEIEVLLASQDPTISPPIWFVAHSNGALIALLVTNRLIEHGHRIGGMILTGAACEADVRKNRVLGWLQSGRLGLAAAYCSATDRVVPPGPGGLKAWLWRRLVWPYGSLGRTGWLGAMPASSGPSRLLTRWFAGGHSTYFAAANRARTFAQIFADLKTGTDLASAQIQGVGTSSSADRRRGRTGDEDVPTPSCYLSHEQSDHSAAQ
jgi:pimeloyl-ACP methyl ester carboxylesterase